MHGNVGTTARRLGKSIGRAFEKLAPAKVGIYLIGSLVVIVSFGKSGRTWVRVLISRFYQVCFGLRKQTLLGFMNGAMPQVALEHGRKTISAYERPTIDEVEQETLASGGSDTGAARREAA